MVARTGSGPARARAAAEALAAAAHPGAIAVAGVAGALVPDLAPGTLVVADRVIDEQGTLVASLQSAGLIAAAMQRRGLPAVVGTVATSDRIVRGARRSELAAKGAIAVDMESSALLNQPWAAATVVVRAVADTPQQELWSVGMLAEGARAGCRLCGPPRP